MLQFQQANAQMYGDAEPVRPHLAVTNVLIMEWLNDAVSLLPAPRLKSS